MTAADRDTLAALIAEGYNAPPHNSRIVALADRILESDWLAQRDRRVAAQTLRDAADDYMPNRGEGGPVRLWLRDRADTTEGTHHD